MLDVKLMTTRNNKQPVLLTSINHNLNMGKQLWYTLDFIDNCPIVVLNQKPLWVSLGKLTGYRIFQIGVRLICKNSPSKGCFARLSWSGNGHNRIFACYIGSVLA